MWLKCKLTEILKVNWSFFSSLITSYLNQRSNYLPKNFSEYLFCRLNPYFLFNIFYTITVSSKFKIKLFYNTSKIPAYFKKNKILSVQLGERAQQLKVLAALPGAWFPALHVGH